MTDSISTTQCSVYIYIHVHAISLWNVRWHCGTSMSDLGLDRRSGLRRLHANIRKQYVGETENALHIRLNGHRSDIRTRKRQAEHSMQDLIPSWSLRTSGGMISSKGEGGRATESIISRPCQPWQTCIDAWRLDPAFYPGPDGWTARVLGVIRTCIVVTQNNSPILLWGLRLTNNLFANVVSLWNALPEAIVSVPSPCIFKHHLYKLYSV